MIGLSLHEERDELESILELKDSKKTSSFSFINKLKGVQGITELNTGVFVDYLEKIASMEEASSYLKPYAEWLIIYFENLCKIRESIDANVNNLDALDKEELLNKLKNSEKDQSVVLEKETKIEEYDKNSLAEIRKKKMMEKMNQMKEKFLKMNLSTKNSEELLQIDNDSIKIETVIQDFSTKEDDS